MLSFNNNKAGLGLVDKEEVNRVIQGNTGKNFGSFAKRKEERLEEQRKQIRATISALSEADAARSEEAMASLAVAVEKERELGRHCVHVDMDAFFAAVEMRDLPELRRVPMAVGSLSMLGTSNYLARRFGVRAAMPGFIARKLCPELVIVPGNYDKYSRESKVIASVLSEYDEDLCMGSLDEAYLDITRHLQQRTEPVSVRRIRFTGSCECMLPVCSVSECVSDSAVPLPEESCTKCGGMRVPYEDSVIFGCSRRDVVKEMRFRIEQATGLTASAGIAPNHMLAKICSDIQKPNGQFELANDREAVLSFLAELPIRKVSGVGAVAEARLAEAGITTCGDVLARRALLPHILSPTVFNFILRVALGVGWIRSGEQGARKSLSVERTFSPTSSLPELSVILRDISEQLQTHLQQSGVGQQVLYASSLTLKMKLSSFDTLTRTADLPRGTQLNDQTTICKHATAVLEKHMGREMRLLGVKLSRLVFTQEDGDCQPTVVDLLKRRTAVKRTRETEDISDTTAGTEEGGCVWLCEKRDNSAPSSSFSPSTSSARSLTSCSSSAECPLCGRKLDPSDIRGVNWHIDSCLSRDAIREALLPPETSQAVHRKKRKVTLDNFFSKS